MHRSQNKNYTDTHLHSKSTKINHKQQLPNQQYSKKLRELLQTKKFNKTTIDNNVINKDNQDKQKQLQEQIRSKQKKYQQEIIQTNRIQQHGQQFVNECDSSIQDEQQRDILNVIQATSTTNINSINTKKNYRKHKRYYTALQEGQQEQQKQQISDNTIQKSKNRKVKLPKLCKLSKNTKNMKAGGTNHLKASDRQLISNYMNAVLVQVGGTKSNRIRKKKINKTQNKSFIKYSSPDSVNKLSTPLNISLAHRNNCHQNNLSSRTESLSYAAKNTQQNSMRNYDSLPKPLLKWKKQKYSKAQFRSRYSVDTTKPNYYDGIPPELNKNPQVSHQNHIYKTPVKKQKQQNKSNYNSIEDNNTKQILKGNQTIKSKQKQSIENNTLLGWEVIDPLLLETYFIKLKSKKVQESENVSQLARKKPLQIPQIPNKQGISHFIKNYIPENRSIIIDTLVKSPTFQVIYELSKQNQQTSQCLYFGQTLKTNSNIKNGLGIAIGEKYIYQGQWLRDIKINGVQKSKTGMYKGNFKNNKRDGEGQFYWSHGEYYSGQWKNGKKSGSGYWKSQAGQSYMGEWSDGQVHGYGVHTMKNGRKFQGQFYNFLKHGSGIQQFPNGDVYQGKYIMGNPHGIGKYFWKNGYKYEGQFFEGYRQGKGKIQHQSSYSFIGNFQKQKVQKLGIIKYTNGDIYEGMFLNSKKNGEGIFKVLQQKKIIKGIWKDNQIINKQNQQQQAK